MLRRSLLGLTFLAFSYVIPLAPVYSQTVVPSNLLKEQIITTVQQAFEDLQTGDAKASQLAGMGAKLLDVKVRRGKVTLNFSQELLSYSDDALEQVLDHILTSIGNATIGRLSGVDYQILIDGTPLEQFFLEIDRQAIKQIPSEPTTLTQESDVKTQQISALASTSLLVKRIVISPGHGWYWNEGCTCWRLQRAYFWGIVEDLVNAEMMMYLNTELAAISADVRPTRNMNKSAGTGETGHPKWEESAKYHIKALGAPSSVWNDGATDLEKDIRSRPNYANWISGNVLVSIHNNGGGGTGTETWYDSGNGYQVQSLRLASLINNRVVSTIRQQYNAR